MVMTLFYYVSVIFTINVFKRAVLSDAQQDMLFKKSIYMHLT